MTLSFARSGALLALAALAATSACKKQDASATNGADSTAAAPASTISLPVVGEEVTYCRANHAAVEDWAARHPDREIGLVHMPLPIHPAAEGAARAALCADEAAKGPEMHQLPMTSEAWRSDTNWQALAASAGVSDSAGFDDCLQSSRITERLARGAELAASLGITGTPTFMSASGRAERQQSVELLEALQ